MIAETHIAALATSLLCCGALAQPGQEPGIPARAESPVRIDADFPGGNIVVERIDGDVVSLHQAQRDTKEWWFYWCFRVSGAEGRSLTFNFTNGALIGARGPAVSLDEGVTWKWLGKQRDYKSFTYSFPASARNVRFSFGMSYTEAHLNRFLDAIGPNPALEKQVLCQSRKGREVERLRIGRINGEPRYRVLLTSRSHACEMMASYAVEGLIDAFLAGDEQGKWCRENLELLVIPFVDKDGVEEGDQGKLRLPRDHNRDYDERSLYPETREMQKFVPKWSAGKLRVALDLHCPYIRGGLNERISLVGSQNPEIWQQQQRFSRILERVQKGPLVYKASDNLPFGTSWNAGQNNHMGTSAPRWAASIPGVQLAATLELPYATAMGKEVNAETARGFGRDLVTAVRGYLEGQTDP